MTTLSITQSASRIKSAAHLAITRAQAAGCLTFDGHAPGAAELGAMRECARLADEVEDLLPAAAPAEVPALLDALENLSRIGRGKAPDSRITDRERRRAFDAWLEGDPDMSESLVFGMIAPVVESPRRHADPDMRSAYRRILDSWLADLAAHGDFPRQTTYERYSRLALLLPHRIKLSMPNAQCPMRNATPDEICNESSSLTGTRTCPQVRTESAHCKVPFLIPHSSFPIESTLILTAYRRYLQTLSVSGMDYDDYLRLDGEVVAELLTRRDLDPAERAALSLEQEMEV